MTQEEAQEKCQKIYLNNLHYLEEKHPDVFKNISLFDVAISENMYEEKYALEIVNKAFDIRILNDNSLLYNKDLNKDAMIRVQNIKLDTKNSFKTFEESFVPDKYTIDKDITNTILETVYPLIDYVQKNSPKKIKLQKIEKFIFFGNLLGAHIELFVKKYLPKVILITEQDIELFRLSLFVTDYSKIAQTSDIIFSLTQDTKVFENDFSKFLEHYSLFNYIIKFNLANNNYLKFIDTVLGVLSTTQAKDWPFTRSLLSIKRQNEYIKSKYNLMDLTKEINTIKNVPILVVSPGPSLIQNIDWLKKNINNFLVISFGATLKTLYKYDIQPDIIISVDPKEVIANQFDGIPKTFYEKCLIFAASISSPNVLELLNKKNTYLFQVVLYIFKIGILYGKSVGDATIALLLKLNANNIYLLGTDLSVDKKTGSTHTKEHMAHKEKENVEEHNMIKNHTITSDDLIKTKGNFEDTVFTTRHFKVVLELYKSNIKDFAKEDTIIINMSDGAFIEGTISKNSKDIKNMHKIDKKNILEKLKSEIKPTNLITNNLILTIDILTKIVDFLNNFKNKKYNTYENMMYDKLTINIETLTMAREENYAEITIGLMNSFNNNVEGYFNSFFTSKKNKTNYKRFNTVFQLWLHPQILMFERYKELLIDIDMMQKNSKQVTA